MSEWFLLFIVVPFLIGFAGSLVKRAVLGKRKTWPDDPDAGFTGFRRWYYATLGAHALVVGFLIGLAGHWIGLPKPGIFGDGLGGSLIAYAFAGAVATVFYDAIVKTIRRIIGGFTAPSPADIELTPADIGEDP